MFYKILLAKNETIYGRLNSEAIESKSLVNVEKNHIIPS